MTPAFDIGRLAGVFGNCFVHDEAKGSVTLWHTFGDEDFLRGHFPGFPVVPGVILLDGMMLVCLHALDRLMGRAPGDVRQAAVDSVAFYRPVLPAMTVGFSMRVAERQTDPIDMRCAVMVDGVRHARAGMTFRLATTRS